MSKKPEGKPKLSFIYTSMLNEIARVREYGNKKHGSLDDWKTTKPIQHYESAERHIRSLMDNEWIDSESGFSHAAHAICNLMFEIERKKYKDSVIEGGGKVKPNTVYTLNKSGDKLIEKGGMIIDCNSINEKGPEIIIKPIEIDNKKIREEVLKKIKHNRIKPKCRCMSLPKDIPQLSESAIINPEIWNKFKKKIKKGVLRKTKNDIIIKSIDKILKRRQKDDHN